MRLVLISELLVLSVSHVAELNVRLMTGARSIPSAVLPAVVEEQNGDSAKYSRFHGYDGDLCWRVVRCVLVTERQRSEDVAETKRHE